MRLTNPWPGHQSLTIPHAYLQAAVDRYSTVEVEGFTPDGKSMKVEVSRFALSATNNRVLS